MINGLQGGMMTTGKSYMLNRGRACRLVLMLMTQEAVLICKLVLMLVTQEAVLILVAPHRWRMLSLLMKLVVSLRLQLMVASKWRPSKRLLGLAFRLQSSTRKPRLR